MADYEYDDSTTIYGTRQPLEERWPPLGAASMEQESPFRNMENERYCSHMFYFVSAMYSS